MSPLNTTFPTHDFPFVDNGGRLTAPWLQFLQQMWFRTGGAVPDTGSDGFLQSALTATPSDAPRGDAEYLGYFASATMQNAPNGLEWWLSQSQTGDSVPPALALAMACLTATDTAETTSRNYAPKAISVGGSPFSFVAPTSGVTIVSGGTVSLVEISRDGTTFYTTGVTAGLVPMRKNDTLRVTFSSTPTMTFFPM